MANMICFNAGMNLANLSCLQDEAKIAVFCSVWNSGSKNNCRNVTYIAAITLTP